MTVLLPVQMLVECPLFEISRVRTSVTMKTSYQYVTSALHHTD